MQCSWEENLTLVLNLRLNRPPYLAVRSIIMPSFFSLFSAYHFVSVILQVLLLIAQNFVRLVFKFDHLQFVGHKLCCRSVEISNHSQLMQHHLQLPAALVGMALPVTIQIWVTVPNVFIQASTP